MKSLTKQTNVKLKGNIRWMSLVEEELLTLPEHLSSPPIFVSGIRVAQSLIIRVDVLSLFN
jgi:hypothetical protein